MSRILVTGAATWIGGRIVSILERRPGVEVLAVDEIPPRTTFTSPFTLLDADRTELAHHVLDVDPDVVVHLLTVDRSVELGQSRAHGEAVLGIQAVFGAVGRSGSVRKVVVKSDAAIYPIGPRSPSVLTEAEAARGGSGRYGRELTDLEAVAAAVAERHPHITFTVLRPAPIFGGEVGNPISRYLSLATVPTRLGYDPRLHLIHESDVIAAFLTAIDRDAAGTFNVAAPGPSYLSRILRLGRRKARPLPRRVLEQGRRALAYTGLHLPAHVARMLEHGLVLDTSAISEQLGFEPGLSTRDTVLAGYGLPVGAGHRSGP